MTTEYTNISTTAYSPEEIAQIGGKFYFDELKDVLENEKRGQYAVIDVVNKKYVVDPDKLVALDRAEKEFGKQLFYIIQVGNLQKPTTNFKKRLYAWQFW